MEDVLEPLVNIAASRPGPEELCARYLERVYRFAAMVSRNHQDADDLAQEAMERAIRGLPGFDPSKGEIEAWLWRIVVNAGRDAGRVARRQQALAERAVTFLSRPPPSAGGVPPGVPDADLLAAVRQLRPRGRALIALRFGADLDYGAVGRAVGLSPAAARMATQRALDELRTRLDHEVDDPPRPDPPPRGGRELKEDLTR
jgi:RNA polymerase sigma factor (sigma-70 family)